MAYYNRLLTFDASTDTDTDTDINISEKGGRIGIISL